MAARSLPTILELGRTDCPGVCTCRAGYRHEQLQERSRGWPRARHQSGFPPDMARRGALQAKAPGIHPDEVGGHAPTSAGQSLPAEGGGRVCMRPEPLGAGSTGGATPRMIRGQVWSEVP